MCNSVCTVMLERNDMTPSDRNRQGGDDDDDDDDDYDDDDNNIYM